MDNTQLCREIKNLCEEILCKIEHLSENRVEPQTPKKQGPEDIILDFQDVCQLLHISLRHLRRLKTEKKLIGFKIGRRRFYRASEVRQYIHKVEVEKNK